MTLLSGFTMMRNASKLYYPAVESVRSALPIVDEFVVALGRGDPDDDTEERLRALRDPKVRIIERTWDRNLYRGGEILAHETTFALGQCSSTWCLYLQADEVLHEDDLSTILEYCSKYRDDRRVEGLLFDYSHFWGDYEHHLDSHGICRREVRIVRNGIGAFSYLDAVSFRKPHNEKLRVVRIPARIYHYGYVRPPELMAVKNRVQDGIHSGREVGIAEAFGETESSFDYGPLGELPRFPATHPGVMRDFILRHNWRSQLNYGRRTSVHPIRHKHERLRYRILSWFERRFTDNLDLFGWKNYRLVRRPSPRPVPASARVLGLPESDPGTPATTGARDPRSPESPRSNG
jgi:hypothetical protein